MVEDPEYLKKERAELRRQPLNFDYIGLGLLVLIMSSWEIMLSKGQEWDWYNDPFWRVQTLFVVFVLGLACLIFRETADRQPGGQLPAAGRAQLRRLAASSSSVRTRVLYGASTSLPGLLQSLFGYDAYVSGLVQSPSGIFSIMMLIVVGILLGRGTDARWLIAVGLLDHGGRQLLDGDDEPVHQPDAGDLAAGRADRRPVDDLRADQRGRLQIHSPASARGRRRPVRLLRNEGGSVGTSMAQTIESATRAVPHGARGRVPRPLNPAVEFVPEQSQAVFLQQTGDPAALAADGLAGARGPARAAGGLAGLLRRLLAVRRARRWRWCSWSAYEALGGREGGAHRRGVDVLEPHVLGS